MLDLVSGKLDPVRVGPNRVLAGAAAALCFAAAAIGGDREVAAHDALMTVVLLLGLGLVALFYARMALKPGARLIIDTIGITDVPGKRTTRWDDVTDVRLLKRQGTFGQYHWLRLQLRDGDHVELKLDLLRPGWRSVTQIVAERSGRSVTTSQQSRREAARA
jgi:hypothetical protein